MKKNKIFNITLSASMLALLIIASKITIPLTVIPLTLQTIVVFLIPLILKRRYASLVFITYIIIGLLGLPVFSSGGGFSYIYKPSFGFIIGFLLSSLVISQAKPETKFYKKLLLSFLGLIIIYTCGILYMYIILNYHLKLDKDLVYCLNAGIAPFILKDSLSLILSVLVYQRIKGFAPSKENVRVIKEQKKSLN